MFTIVLPVVGLIVAIVALATTPKDERHKVPRIVDWFSFALSSFLALAILVCIIIVATV